MNPGPAFTNRLGMRFLPAGTTGVLVSVWETRTRDFSSFVAATGHDATRGMSSLGGDRWRERGHSWRDPGFPQGPDHPVVGVSWEDAKAFCAWLTSGERLGGGRAYRLPTDVEWSRAVGEGTYPWGEAWPPTEEAGNYAGEEARGADWPASMKTIPSWCDGWARTSPVGTFRANAYGLHDLGGNLWEWCEDYYRREMNSAEVLAAFPRTAEDGEGRKYRVARGGSWLDSDPLALRASTRRRGLPDLRVTAFGFRCVLASA